MIENERESLRLQLSEIRSKKSTSRRYPKQLREAVAAYVRGQRRRWLLISDRP